MALLAMIRHGQAPLTSRQVAGTLKGCSPQ